MVKENHAKIWNVIYLIIILICFRYIISLNLKLKEFNSEEFLNDKIRKHKNKLLDRCYKSRNLIYEKDINFNKSNIMTIQEKLKYLIVHESPDYKSKIADKILVHEYSKKILGKDICVPIIKIYEDAKDIKMEELPDKFVLKCNHGSGMNILCNNKSNFDLKSAKLLLNNWKDINFGLIRSEFQYINIKRKIFSEIYLKDNIEDYKIYCFHGIPKFIRVQKIINETNEKINNYYDLNWKLTNIETGLPGFYRRPDIIFEKPKNFDLMLEYSKKLSEEFVFVRVDLYNINGKIYLGEMTFSPSNFKFKLKDRNQSIELGNLIDINKIKKYLFN